MKVDIGRYGTTPGSIARAVSLVFVIAFSLSVSTPEAHAITRDRVIARANTWIAKRVPYSQRGHYGGYRRDCSGFVSMAWGLRGSYTSRSIASRAKRIPISKLRPGDAVRYPGHVAVFGGWKDRRRGLYIALEQTTWGGHATRHVKKMRRGTQALRLKGISDAPPRASAATGTPVGAAGQP